MDQLLDELVLLDPKISKALTNAPRVQFETFRLATTAGPAASSSPRRDIGVGDLTLTFLTACRYCSFLPACPGAAAEPGLTPRQQQQQQQPGDLLRQPEVACSAELFDYSMRAAASGSCGAKGRARLHSMHMARSQYNSLAGASAEAAALGASAAVARFLAAQQHPLASTAGPACLQQRAVQHVAPSMQSLQYQMEHIRQLHLDGVKTPGSLSCKGSLGQQQQQQPAAELAGNAWVARLWRKRTGCYHTFDAAAEAALVGRLSIAGAQSGRTGVGW
ncbi:hypothetical protein COO60DRAFT_1692217 [Scenedesmus sp. NREL 46B-D3]|nr:hypothetical protein COO60DRAFT_1692217 [Scenedesmus sp. NREL 46B-D3]